MHKDGQSIDIAARDMAEFDFGDGVQAFLRGCLETPPQGLENRLKQRI